MYTPAATYRVQLHKDFTFRQLEAIIDYLHELGISTVYASPITSAGKGSTHGYDVTDPGTINPEIGTEEQLQQLAARLKEKGMGWLQDIVPNHMAFSPENRRLMDALERDALSDYYGYFDINWKHPAFPGKLMVPFLGDPLDICIQQGDIQIVLTGSGMVVQYEKMQYPLSISAYRLLLSVFVMLSKGIAMPQSLSWLLTGDVQNDAYATWQQHKANLFGRLMAHAKNRKLVEQWLSVVNTDHGLLRQLLDSQYYRLCHWQEVDRTINYRRFFTISSLICLRMEAETVFNDYHRYLHQLCRQGWIQGLRIDHIDGLYDPGIYIQRLRRLFGESCYIIAEKILEDHEALPADWLLQGTSGYEFLSEVSQLLTHRQGGAQLSLFYQTLLPGEQSYTRQVIQNKLLVLQQYMKGEWDNLVRYFLELDLEPYPANWKDALAALMVALPVYRIYPTQIPVDEQQRLVLEEAIALALQTTPLYSRELKYLHSLFCGENGDPEEQAAILLFLKRMMQFTGPLMAKGVEDTTFYTYNALVSHNEVGDTPLVQGNTIGQFHAAMKARQAATPLSLNATATHDTKRGEDARMRLNVLTEMPELWQQEVQSWFYLNEGLHSIMEDEPAPTRNEEYFIYQSIIGGFPEDGIITEEWIQRLQQYILKAIREAKVNTNWNSPRDTYEQACMDFIHKLFDKDHGFLRHLLPLMKQIGEQAAIYSLGQLLVKIMAPGIPDIYQGCELWDFSFVDPDNRRPVDYVKRIQYLQQVKEQEAQGAAVLFPFLREHRPQGLEKLFLCYKALHFRRDNNEWLVKSDYLPLKVSGEKPAAVAFARHHREQWAITVIPVHDSVRVMGRLAGAAHQLPAEYLELPAEAPVRWHNVLTGQTEDAKDHRLPLRELWGIFPVALLQPA